MWILNEAWYKVEFTFRVLRGFLWMNVFFVYHDMHGSSSWCTLVQSHRENTCTRVINFNPASSRPSRKTQSSVFVLSVSWAVRQFCGRSVR